MQIDTTINTLVESIHTPILTLFSKLIAIIFDPITIAIISLAIATFLYVKKSKTQAILLASTVFIAGITIKLLKEIFQRTRPPSTLIQETGFSFPSGTTTMAIVFLGLIIYISTKHKSTKIKTTACTITTLIVFLIGFTRIYLQAHWITDVIAGIILGTTILTIAILTYKKYKQRTQ